MSGAEFIENGYKIKKVKDSIIFHDNNAAGENLLTKKFLGKEIFIPKIPNWKMYYFIRNNILMYKLLCIFLQLELICLYEKDNRRNGRSDAPFHELREPIQPDI